MSRFLLLFLLFCTLAACGSPPAATPDAIATQVAQAQAVAATLTAAVPTATLTSVPTDTSTPTATDTPAPTPTPSPTRTPRPTHTPIPTPTPQLGSKQNPFPMGARALFHGYEVTTRIELAVKVSKVLRGDEALRFVKNTERFFAPLHEQQEFLLAYVELDYLKGPEDTMYRFAAWVDFGFSTETDVVVQPDIAVYEPLDGDGYAPLHLEGWVRGRIRKDSPMPTLVFAPSLQFELGAGRSVAMAHFSLDGEEGEEASAVTAVPPTSAPTKVSQPTATATPAMQLLADSQADFTGGQGQNGWEYLFSEGQDSFNWTQMSFDGSCYRSPFTEEQIRICPDHGAPGAGGDIAWLYKAEASGTLVFKVTAKKAETPGDDIEIKVYRHTEDIKEWDLYEGNTAGFTKQFEVNANGGEMFFFTMQVQSIWREFQYDPNTFRVQVYLKE